MIFKKNFSLLIFFLIALLCFTIYANTLKVPFQFDDIGHIRENVLIRSFSNLGLLWKNHPTRFLTYFTFFVNYHFGRLDVFGYHLANTLIHLSATLLVYALVHLTFKTPRMKGSSLEKHARPIAFLQPLFF